MKTKRQHIADLVTSLAALLPNEETMYARAEVVATATHALVRMELVREAHQVFESAFSALSVKTWKPDNLKDELLPGDVLCKILESTGHLIIGIGRKRDQSSLVEDLITKASAIIKRLRTKQEANEYQTSSCIWELLRALAAIGRLDDALRQAPRIKEDDESELEVSCLVALTWKAGFPKAAASASARLLKKHPWLRFSLATAKLSVGDHAGAQTLIKPLDQSWKQIYAEHVLDHLASHGSFTRALAMRSSCRHGARSCAERLAGTAANQGRWAIVRRIIAEERAAGAEHLSTDLHWVLLQAKVGEDAILLKQVEHGDDLAANVHWLVQYAIHLRSQGIIGPTLARLAAAALRLGLSPAAKRRFYNEEYGMCLATAIAADKHKTVEKLLRHAAQKESWHSNLKSCCDHLATPGTVMCALRFLEKYPKLRGAIAESGCAISLVRTLATMGDHKGLQRAYALLPKPAQRCELYAATLMGMAKQKDRGRDIPLWAELVDG